jgi:hypothetical protein
MSVSEKSAPLNIALGGAKVAIRPQAGLWLDVIDDAN